MKDQKLKETLNAVLCRVLEQTAFVFPESVDDITKIDPSAMEFVRVSLQFSGSETGTVSLILPLDLCGEICSSMLGQDPSECAARECRVDAAKEVVNIVTGQLLTDIFGTEKAFRQSTPESADLTPETFFGALEGIEYTYCMVDKHPVILTYKQKKAEPIHEH